MPPLSSYVILGNQLLSDNHRWRLSELKKIIHGKCLIYGNTLYLFVLVAVVVDNVVRNICKVWGFFFNLFIYLGCVGSPSLHRLSLVVVSRGYSLLRCTGSRRAGFSSCGSWA